MSSWLCLLLKKVLSIATLKIHNTNEKIRVRAYYDRFSEPNLLLLGIRLVFLHGFGLDLQLLLLVISCSSAVCMFLVCKASDTRQQARIGIIPLLLLMDYLLPRFRTVRNLASVPRLEIITSNRQRSGYCLRGKALPHTMNHILRACSTRVNLHTSVKM